ncbi:hypothetical protein EJ03DRAFT_178474 [Teratosphaeria nubilosa]|uniref:Uncharacterized protein n=1 Tax=Teratosphaeria nubilosa TaxID=161662 RepID=A0A6G1L1S7_9PEZI|nr:hypothetical protein EJ03DRAFT_178474 [Teratosphaeria nubilosa]
MYWSRDIKLIQNYSALDLKDLTLASSAYSVIFENYSRLMRDKKHLCTFFMIALLWLVLNAPRKTFVLPASLTLRAGQTKVQTLVEDSPLERARCLSCLLIAVSSASTTKQETALEEIFGAHFCLLITIFSSPFHISATHFSQQLLVINLHMEAL